MIIVAKRCGDLGNDVVNIDEDPDERAVEDQESKNRKSLDNLNN